MAKKEETAKVVLERVYTVPLRKEYQKVAKWRRTEKTVTALRKFISRHMKSENVVIGKYVNQFLWKNGIKNPPHHVKVNAKKDDKGRVTVELAELPAKAKRELEKDKELKKKKEEKEATEKEEEAKKAKEAKKKEEAEKKVEETKKEKEEKAKEEEKEELKELKKEMPKQAIPKPMAAPKQIEQRPTAPKQQQ